MIRLFIIVFACLLGKNPVVAQGVDSLSTTPIYKESDLYPLQMLSAEVWETQFTKGPMGMYNPAFPTARELAKLKPRYDSRIFSTAQTRLPASNVYFILLMAAWLSLSMLIYKNQQYFKSMLGALFNHRLALQFAREQVAHRTAGSIIYLLIFNTLLAMLLAQLVYNFDTFFASLPQALLLTGIIVGVTGMYLFKYAFYKVLGVLFGMRELVSQYLSQVFLIHRMLGPALLLMMAVIYYAPAHISIVALYSALVLLGLSVLWRYITAIRQITNVMVAHAFHFILYFCAVEIIPTAVIVKFLLHA